MARKNDKQITHSETYEQWVDGVRQYAETTGDLEGANTQAMKMCETLEELTGIDAKTWFDGLDFDFAPVEEGTKKLNEFRKEVFYENHFWEKYTKILYSQARLIEGLPIDNPTEISNLICDILSK